MTHNVFSGTLNTAQSINPKLCRHIGYLGHLCVLLVFATLFTRVSTSAAACRLYRSDPGLSVRLLAE